ncbi:GntR family transcriptional regulator [Clostridium sp. Marseille-Q2269]|uniref:GntR family transcriptional regulator n=1 Tax=Clostridium sp. Marseille-Q2269 TaxID=2942205 RepID=UPI0020741797|nr:GntR family transcriptional regulator [Clostridium sp. Marseille-Q2269]
MADIRIKRIKKVSVVQKVIENLKQYIKETENELLPTEDKLSKLLGVSILTIREAVTVLEREGIVSRIQGKGTIINTFVTKLENRIDFGCDIEGCLRKNGYNVKFKVINLEFRKATDEEREKLELDSEEEILVVEKVLYANEDVAAFYIDRIPKKRLTSLDITEDLVTPCIFPTIERLCDTKITHDVVHIYTDCANKKLSNIFNIKIRNPLLKFEVFEYDYESKILMFDTEYYTNRFIKFTLCRNTNYKFYEE